MDKILHEIINLISRKDNRIIIGISGQGASGKTTFANNLLKILGHDIVNYVNTDPYIIGSSLRKYAFIDYEYKNQLHHDKMTACHPAAHNILALERYSYDERWFGFLYNRYELYKEHADFFAKQNKYCRRYERCIYRSRFV